MSRLVLPDVDIRLPTASRPRLNFFANASLTIATFCDVVVSASVNSRPAISGTPRVRKKLGPIWLKLEWVSVSGPAWNPWTLTPLPQLLPPSSGTIDAATPVTPGTDASSCSSRLKNAWERAVS